MGDRLKDMNVCEFRCVKCNTVAIAICHSTDVADFAQYAG